MKTRYIIRFDKFEAIYNTWLQYIDERDKIYPLNKEYKLEGGKDVIYLKGFSMYKYNTQILIVQN